MDQQHHELSKHLGRYVNLWLKISLIGSVLLNIILSVVLTYQMRHKMVVMVPPVMTHQASVSLVRPDESYLVQMGLFWLGLKLNISADNVEQNHRILKTHIVPSKWGEIHNILEEEAKAVKKGRINSVFYPVAQAVDGENLRLKITGKLQKRIGERLISDKTAHFIMGFVYQNGALQIKALYQIEEKQDG